MVHQPDDVPVRAFDGVVGVAVAAGKLVRRQVRGDGDVAGHDRLSEPLQ